MTNLKEIGAMATSLWLTEHSVNASIDNLPLLWKLYKRGRMKRVDFAYSIKYPTVLASKQVKATDSSGTGMTNHNEQANYAAEVFFKTVPVVRTISKDLIDLSKSKEKAVEQVLGVMTSSQSSVLNSVNDMLYGDGTAFNGNALDGVSIAISKTPNIGVYAGIDPSVTTQWQNFAANQLDPASGTPYAGTALNESNILSVLGYVLAKLDENGRKPDLICASSDYYNLIERALQPFQRLNDTTIADAGFRSINFQGIEIINAGGLKRSQSITGAVGGIPDKTMYFMSLSVAYLAYHNPYYTNGEAKRLGIETSDINAIVYPEMANGMLLNTDKATLDYFVKMVFKGNFVIADRKVQGVLYEEPITPAA